ncbi:MAG: glycosyltransferase family 2 protein [Gammaproteobacteria bacterium]|nr:glycosyltransferase family 2 protein [Gammaproteobacteria bacterium]
MPYLKMAVESVLAQTRKPDEITVADDGSTDGSRDYLRSLHATYPKIKSVFRESNLGVAMNRDLAVRSARSVFVTTLDGDDAYHGEKIEKELNLLDGSLESVVFSDVALINEDGNFIKLLEFDEFSQLNKAEQLHNLLYRKLPIPRDMMLSKQLFIECGGIRHNQKLYEDWDLKLRLLRHAKQWKYNHQVGTEYRQHASGLSNTDPLTHLTCQLEVIINNQEWLRRTAGNDHVFMAMLERVVDNMGYSSVKLVK